MPDTGPSRADVRRRLLRRASGVARVVVLVLYVGTALLGTLVTPPVTLLMMVPLVAVSAVIAVTLVQLHLHRRWPTRRATLTSAALGAAFLPFGEGIPLLGGAGAIVVPALLGMLPVVVAQARTTAPVRRPQTGAEAPSSSSTTGGASLGELLGTLPTASLLDEWHDSTAGIAPLSSGPRHEASLQLRELLLAELLLRHPAGVQRWLDEGATGSPEAHLHDDLAA